MALKCRFVLAGQNSLINLELSVISLAVNGAIGCCIACVAIFPPTKGNVIGACSVDIVEDEYYRDGFEEKALGTEIR